MPAKPGNPILVALCAAALLAPAGPLGCGGGPKLTTHTVRGKVVFEKGGSVQKLHAVEAAVAFESIDPPGVRATAAIAEDGSLANVVSTAAQGSGYGLPAGTYRVRLDLDPEHRGLVHPRFLSYDKSGITVRVPADEIVITVSR